MKLEFVEIAGFRGFKERTRFDFAAGFVVLTGRNGAGKSTVLDAIDFAVTGSINKFTTRTARGGGLGEHIWWVGQGFPSESFVSVGFIKDNGQRLNIVRGRQGLLAGSEATIQQLCGTSDSPHASAETLMKTSLIRDEFIVALSVDQSEQARFEAVKEAIGGLVGPDFTERTAEIVSAASAERDAQLRRVDAAQTELGRALSALTEARSAAERSPNVSEALGIVERLNIPLPAEGRNDALREIVAQRKRRLAELERTIDDAYGLQAELNLISSKEWKSSLAEKEVALVSARDALVQAKNILELATRAYDAERESDAFAAHLNALVEHGSAIGLEDGHCPLCNAFRSAEEFEQAIAAARSRLAGRGERLSLSSRAVMEAEDKVAVARNSVDRLEDEVEALTQQGRQVQLRLEDIQRAFKQYSFNATADNPDDARIKLLDDQEGVAQLERALFILEASGAVDRIMNWQSRVATLRQNVDAQSTKLADLERSVEDAKQIQSSAKTIANQILAEQFDTVMPLLQELYRRLRPHSEWRDIESDFGGKVRGSLNFTVGNGHNVQFLFSSGQRRAMGLAFLLSIHLSRRWCEWRSLLLDDPVQHIDDYRALNLVEVLSAIRRTGRQVIVAVEDQALAEVLCHKLRSSIEEPGRRFDLTMSKTGSSAISGIQDIVPMPRQILRSVQVS